MYETIHLSQKTHTTGYLLVNFGGPRTLSEVESFLRTLLTDQDVVETGMPQMFHNLIFRRVAKKRTHEVSGQYAEIGGCSPIYEDTEAVAKALEDRLNAPVFTFHRYLPATHAASFEALNRSEVERFVVFPMFPQFTYATTGSIARLFYENLPPKTLQKLQWIRSYPTHPAFVNLLQSQIQEWLTTHQLCQKEVILLFSAHGLPKKFVDAGDPYESECRASFQKVMEAFPDALGRLAFQSKFGPGEWLRPYTIDVCEGILSWHEGREHVLFIPLSFTSDHIETLFEMEREYLPVVADQGLKSYRLPAFNRRSEWIDAIRLILEDRVPVPTPMLIRWFRR